MSPGTTIIVRPGAGSGIGSIELIGSLSGPHGGEWVIAGGGTTWIFRPDEPLAPGETVSVRLDDFSYRFTVAPPRSAPNRERLEPCTGHGREGGLLEQDRAMERSAGLALPFNFPDLAVTVNDGPAPGYVFAGPRKPNKPPPHFALMLENDGAPAFFRQLPRHATDFKKQKHAANRYSWLQYADGEFSILDETLEVLDTFSPGNGYPDLDGHDFQITPNGNVLIGIIDIQTIDMSQIVPGGHPAATVIGFVLQEQDPAHNVVFQWRSWDHIPITDACGVDFTSSWIDAVHFNSFEIDDDGDILISFRELCEATKIDRVTGDVLWRLGGNQNEFTLVGDTKWFERQHSIRRTDTGTITVFDNGALQAPFESRAVEYSVDETNKIATLVWQFVDDPPLFAGFGGNAQRLPNGNTLINWAPLGIVTEVRPDGTKAFELQFTDHWTYRAFRWEWDGVASRPELWFEVAPFEATLHFSRFGDPDVAHYNVYADAFSEPTVLAGSTPGNTFTLPLAPLDHVYVRVTAEDGEGNESPFSNEVLIIGPVPVNAPHVEASSATISLAQNLPNPFSPPTSIAFALPARDLVELAIYDVRGRLVRRLASGTMEAGTHELVWDGLDAAGRATSAGVYFYRLNAGGATQTRRMTLLRP